MKPSSDCDSQELLIQTIHDIRQPIGNIEISAYMLNHWLRDAPGPVRDQIRIIERQADLAARILEEASRQIRRALDQREAEDLVRTNSESALVT